MKIEFRAFRITSKFESVSRLPLEKFVLDPQVKQMGWNISQLLDLMAKLQAILQNFEKISENRMRFDIVLCKRELGSKEVLVQIDRDKRVIRISLKPGPQEILNLAPAFLSLGLSGLFSKLNPRAFWNMHLQKYVLVDLEQFIGEGIADIRSFYTNERKLEIDQSDLRNAFIMALAHFGEEITLRKISYLLLGSFSRPGMEIERELGIFMQRTRKDFSRMEIDPGLTDIWVLIGALAMYATLAKKTGHALLYLECQKELTGALGEHMAVIELMQTDSEALKYFRNYPCESSHQLKLAPAGYNLAFNVFQKIFEVYYDSVRMV